jgi:hypothetical protein
MQCIIKLQSHYCGKYFGGLTYSYKTRTTSTYRYSYKTRTTATYNDTGMLTAGSGYENGFNPTIVPSGEFILDEFGVFGNPFSKMNSDNNYIS